jgi:hypothetical protein
MPRLQYVPLAVAIAVVLVVATTSSLCSALELEHLSVHRNVHIVSQDPVLPHAPQRRGRRSPIALPSQYENEQYFASVPRHALNITDLMRVDRLSDAVVSPSGLLAVYSRRVWSVTANVSSTTLWLLDIKKQSNTPLTPFGWKGTSSSIVASMTSISITADSHTPHRVLVSE